MVFLVRGRGAENIEEKIKIDRGKTLINEDEGYKENEEYKESQKTTISIFGFTFFIKNYSSFTRKHNSKR